MKFVKSLILLFILSVFAYANTHSEKNDIKVLNNLYEKVVLKNITQAIKDINSLKIGIKDKNIKNSKNDFAKLVSSWKSVESFYILGDLNEDFIDIPRYIDIFHNGNEDITKQLDRAIKSDDEPRIALFKNSLKSINALEYVIYRKDIKEKRIQEIILAITNRIEIHLKNILNEYLSQKDNFTKDLKKANAIVINTIVQNTYKLKEWRVGDVLGLTKKYENKPDNKRAEYYISKNSSNAISSILQTFKSILNDDKYFDFGDYLNSITNTEQIKDLRIKLNEAIELAEKISNDDFSKSELLYKKINDIHVILFVEMIEELSINAKILDADGD